MKFSSELQRGKLIKRYKRFLADVETSGSECITIHCPNTGSMRNCADPGFGVWFSTSTNAKRKYPNTWELAEDFDGNFIGINTNNANKLVEEAVRQHKIAQLIGYSEIKSEVKYGLENSRIDLLLTGDEREDCYVEVKSVTLNEGGAGYFPDAVSTRGQKHLRELLNIVESGHRAVLVYCVQHTGIQTVTPAREIDPAYATAMDEAIAGGVEVLAYGCAINEREISVQNQLEFVAS